MKSKNTYLVLALVPVLLLSGCGTTDKASVSKTKAVASMPGDVLATWSDGTPVVTQGEFDEMFEFVLKGKPELQNLPEAFLPMVKTQLLNSIVSQKILDKWVADNKVDQTKEYKDEYKMVLFNARMAANVSALAKTLDLAASEGDFRAYYDENKEKIALIAAGGVKAEGVRFNSEAEAKDFLAKAKSGGFDKLVQADANMKKNLRDFQYVNDKSRINKTLRDAILAIKRFPSVMMVKESDKAFWVVNATEKTEAKYQPYEALKAQIEGSVKQTKQQEGLMKKIDGLRDSYGVSIKERVFMPEQPKEPGQGPQTMMPAKGAAPIKKEVKQPVKPAAKAA